MKTAMLFLPLVLTLTIAGSILFAVSRKVKGQRASHATAVPPTLESGLPALPPPSGHDGRSAGSEL